MDSIRGTNVSDIEDEDDLDEEPGEVIESAPPLKVGEERQLNSSGLKKKLLKHGHGWETPEFGDEVTVHYVATLPDGIKFYSTRDREQPITLTLGQGENVNGLDNAIITMTMGETALFTLPPDLGFGGIGTETVPPNSIVKFEVELVSWITVVDICKDGGIVKKILTKGDQNAQPGDLDEVLVKYEAKLGDGTVVAKTPIEGLEFHIKDGHFCPALPKAIKTMKRGEKVMLVIQPQYAFGETGREACNDCSAISPNSVLSIEVELVSFKPVVDVCSDLKVIKKILKEGVGTVTANEGTAVQIRYLAKLENGTVFEKKGFDGDGLLEFITDEEQVIPGLDRAAATMKKGECAVLTISPEYGFGSIEVQRDLALVPPSSTVIFEVEMVDFTQEKASWELSSKEKIEAAGKRKEEGNLLFKSAKYLRAQEKYDKAADYVSEDGSFGDDDQKLAKALRISCWLNGAACSLKLNNYKEGISLCSKVLDVEFCNVKALYRRAQAYMETADLDLAELDIKRAMEADPQNREVKSIQRTLKHLQAESNKRDAKVYTNMFTRMTTNSSIASKKMKVEKADDIRRNEAIAMDVENIGMTAASEGGMVIDSR
ncbi:FKBP-type peptidyl-prolyl cis-trans isomerase domain [Dillenia turbinata]|uniref:peptidylprolyl isomerase n=1 Tax=Dillenia turbinata TaxID=194707 RepID=A0AAN8ZMT4_9MAGN